MGFEMCSVSPLRHMIITDREGFISAISVGLMNRLGIHPKFFQYRNEAAVVMHKMDMLCENIMDPDFKEKLETDGMIMTFDTRDILTKIQGEMLSSEDLELIVNNFRQEQLFVKTVKVPLRLDDYATVYYLQTIRLQNSGAQLTSMDQVSKGGEPITGGSHDDKNDLASESEKYNMSSASSSSGSTNSFGSLIRDFKKTLLERKQPRALKVLDSLVALSLLSTIILATIFYTYLRNGDTKLEKAARATLSVDQRNIYLSSTAIHINTYIGIANDYFHNSFPFSELNSVILRSDNVLDNIKLFELETQQRQTEILELKQGM